MADHCREKLIRRHPHVFGEREAETAGDVVRNWNEIKRDEERGGEIFGDLPETLPVDALREEGPEARQAPAASRDADATIAGDAPARRGARRAWTLGVDPELALRAAADRFRDRWRQS